MLQMLLGILAINQNIIEINYNEFTDERLQHLVHHPHECAQCIRVPKWHHQPFIQTLIRLERCFPFVPGSDPNLVIAAA